MTFTFTPDFGYEVDKVTVNGEEVAVTDNTYTIENVMEDGIEINVTFKASENAKDVPFIVYNDIFEVGNVTTAVIIDLGEGNEANLSDLSADMFSVSARNTRYGMPDTVIFDGSRKISRVYVNNEAKPLGYITPAPGSDDLVTDTPETGRYIVVELEFWDNNGYLSGAMVSGNLQNAYSADLNYSISINSAIELTNGESVIPFFVQEDVVNLTLDKFVHDSTNPGGAGDMDILISIDDSWEEEGPLPLFIYNHGGGRGGSKGDYFAPMQTANGAAVLAKLQMENPDKYKIHIIATQNHSNNQTNNEALMAYVQKLVEEGKVDPDRVYMSGFSMGGMYTMDFYKRNPEFLAAIVPLACATFPTAEQLEENVELTKTSIWGFVHKNDPYGDGTNWPNYFTTGAGATAGYENANVSVMDTNQAFNYPYYGYDWTPHETEAQNYSNLRGQMDSLYAFGPDQEAYADKNIFDWMFDQTRADVADEADKEELNRLIAEVEGYQSEDYTADSFQALQNALEAAKAVSADEFATVSEVDEATYDLALAKNGLVPAVQKEILALAIELAEAEDTSNWTPDSAKALADAIEAGRAVLDNSEATQKEVDDAAMAIVEAMNNSVLMADKDRLAQLIEIVNQLTEDKYTASTWKVCEEKLAQANAVMDDLNATQQQVNDAYKELLNAMVSLQLKAQKAALKSALDIARTILYSADEYVESTIKGLSELVAEGEALYYNDEATQSDVDEMAKALLEAAMKARKLADKAVLQSTVEKAEAVDLTLYTADSVEVFSNALLSAKQVLANVDLSEDDQAQVDNAAMVLTKAMDDLILKTSDSDTPVDETPSTGSDSSNNSDSSNGSDSSDESESAGPATGESDTLLIVLTMMLVMSGIAFLGLRKKSWEK